MENQHLFHFHYYILNHHPYGAISHPQMAQMVALFLFYPQHMENHHFFHSQISYGKTQDMENQHFFTSSLYLKSSPIWCYRQID